LQKRPAILRSLLIVATPYEYFTVLYGCISLHLDLELWGVATISRLLKIIGLFCRISSLSYGSFAKETYNFKEPTHRSLPIQISYSPSRPDIGLPCICSSIFEIINIQTPLINSIHYATWNLPSFTAWCCWIWSSSSETLDAGISDGANASARKASPSTCVTPKYVLQRTQICMWRFLFCHPSHIKAGISDSADACARNASPSNYVSRKHALQCTHTCMWRFIFCRSAHITAGISDDADVCAHNTSLSACDFHEINVQKRINTCMWSLCREEKKILQCHNTFSHVHTHTVSIWRGRKAILQRHGTVEHKSWDTHRLSHTHQPSHTHTLSIESWKIRSVEHQLPNTHTYSDPQTFRLSHTHTLPEVVNHDTLVQWRVRKAHTHLLCLTHSLFTRNCDTQFCSATTQLKVTRSLWLSHTLSLSLP